MNVYKCMLQPMSGQLEKHISFVEQDIRRCGLFMFHCKCTCDLNVLHSKNVNTALPIGVGKCMTDDLTNRSCMSCSKGMACMTFVIGHAWYYF